MTDGKFSDRNLLELAATTLGVKWKWVGSDTNGVLYVLRESAPKGDWHGWNPLTDDGDALRLAVRLRCLPIIEDWSDGPWVFAPSYPECAEPLGDDPYAATRRAIVRAAAEIGKQMN